MTAAALAAILDPDRKVPGWWKAAPIKCGNCSRDGVRDIYTGPANLHTAREHNWRLEDWLEARGYGWRRNWYEQQTTLIADSKGFAIYSDKDHTAALVAAVERIANG